MKQWRTISQRSPKEVTLSFLSKVLCLVLVRFFFCYLRFFLCCPCKVFWGLSLRRPFLSCHCEEPFFWHREPFLSCHCEERSDEAISLFPRKSPSDCFASLATTERGGSLRGPFLSCPCGEPFFWHRGPFLSVIARSIATKQSRLIPRRSPPGGPSDCFAPLAKTKRGMSLRGAFWVCHREGPFFCLVIARSEATKQSRFIPRRSPPGGPSDCFAPLAKTEGEGGPSGCFAPLATTKGGVLARSIATKQSRIGPAGPSDCFAPLATTGGEGGPWGCFASLAKTEGGRHCEEHSDEAISFFPSHINGKGKQIA